MGKLNGYTTRHTMTKRDPCPPLPPPVISALGFGIDQSLASCKCINEDGCCLTEGKPTIHKFSFNFPPQTVSLVWEVRITYTITVRQIMDIQGK